MQEGGAFKVTVADLSRTEMSEGNIMAYAVMMLSRRGEVKFDSIDDLVVQIGPCIRPVSRSTTKR